MRPAPAPSPTGSVTPVGIVFVRLAPGTSLHVTEQSVAMRGVAGERLFQTAAPLAGALTQLASDAGCATDAWLAAFDADVDALARAHAVVHALEAAGYLQYQLEHAGCVLARCVPGRPGFMSRISETPQPAELSRFAYLRRLGDSWMLDSPLALGAVQILQSDLLGDLAHLDAARGASSGDPALIPFLHAAGVLTTAEEEMGAHSSTSMWSFADLLLHASYRSTRRDRRVGATYPWKDRVPPLPARAAGASGHRIKLVRPIAEDFTRSDPPFAAVVEARRSVRRHGAAPVTVAQLSEFLFRVAHTRDGDPTFGAPYEIVRHVYPSGGACYPLELYAIVGHCAGLTPGAYRYDSGEHALEPVARDAEALLAAYTWVMEDRSAPHILIVITARYGRVAWKYEGMAYATILKDVGVLYEAMYLVATAMQLAPCAVGAGSTATIERTLDLAPLEEVPVGEFVLGPLPNEP